MKNRSLFGHVALGAYILALALAFVAFFSNSWIVSDKRIVGAKLDKFGLWVHCYRSLSDPNDPSEQGHFVGCHWIFDPFTNRYSEFKGFPLPHYILATRLFHTIAFTGTLLSAIGSSAYFLCCKPREKRLNRMTFMLGVTPIRSSMCAGTAALIFAAFANRAGRWMPGHKINYFGWTFRVAIASFIALHLSGVFCCLETDVQETKMKTLKIPLKGSQTVIDVDIKAWNVLKFTNKSNFVLHFEPTQH